MCFVPQLLEKQMKGKRKIKNKGWQISTLPQILFSSLLNPALDVWYSCTACSLLGHVLQYSPTFLLNTAFWTYQTKFCSQCRLFGSTPCKSVIFLLLMPRPMLCFHIAPPIRPSVSCSCDIHTFMFVWPVSISKWKKTKKRRKTKICVNCLQDMRNWCANFYLKCQKPSENGTSRAFCFRLAGRMRPGYTHRMVRPLHTGAVHRHWASRTAAYAYFCLFFYTSIKDSNYNWVAH